MRPCKSLMTCGEISDSFDSVKNEEEDVLDMFGVESGVEIEG